jgi:hypothetical protein
VRGGEVFYASLTDQAVVVQVLKSLRIHSHGCQALVVVHSSGRKTEEDASFSILAHDRLDYFTASREHIRSDHGLLIEECALGASLSYKNLC